MADVGLRGGPNRSSSGELPLRGGLLVATSLGGGLADGVLMGGDPNRSSVGELLNGGGDCPNNESIVLLLLVGGFSTGLERVSDG